MGVWWKRATATGAICGMIAGFGLCLFYLLTTRYFPGFGVKYPRDDLDAEPGHQVRQSYPTSPQRWPPNAMEAWPTLAHPLANKVGWFNLNNIACGLLGMPLGFLVIYVVSLMGKAPSLEMRYVDEIRKPRERVDPRRKDPDRPSGRFASGALRGPACARRALDHLSTGMAAGHPGNRRENIRRGRLVSGSWTYWYFHLPNFILGGVDVRAISARGAGVGGRDEFDELYLAFLLPDHRSLRNVHCGFDTQGDGAGGALAVRGGLAVLVARGAAVSVPAPRRRPQHEFEPPWTANSITSALHSSAWSTACSTRRRCFVALIHAQILSPCAFVLDVRADSDVCVVDGLDRDHHCDFFRRPFISTSSGRRPIRPKRHCGSGWLPQGS